MRHWRRVKQCRRHSRKEGRHLDRSGPSEDACVGCRTLSTGFDAEMHGVCLYASLARRSQKTPSLRIASSSRKNTRTPRNLSMVSVFSFPLFIPVNGMSIVHNPRNVVNQHSVLFAMLLIGDLNAQELKNLVGGGRGSGLGNRKNGATVVNKSVALSKILKK